MYLFNVDKNWNRVLVLGRGWKRVEEGGKGGGGNGNGESW